MQIPSYQMQNVLNAYRKQFTRNGLSEPQKASSIEPPGDRVILSTEAKRQAIIEKVSAQILKRIANFGPQEAAEHEIATQRAQDTDAKVAFEALRRSEFVYNYIDDNNQKAGATLLIKDSQGLIDRMEELAKKAVGQTSA
jgi:hypothetical protein